MTKGKTVALAALIVAGIAAGGFAAVRGKAPAPAPAAPPTACSAAACWPSRAR